MAFDYSKGQAPCVPVDVSCQGRCPVCLCSDVPGDMAQPLEGGIPPPSSEAPLGLGFGSPDRQAYAHSLSLICADLLSDTF